jgi:hypothetical protein
LLAESQLCPCHRVTPPSMTQVSFSSRFRLAFAAAALGLVVLAAGCGTTSHQAPNSESSPVERPVAMKATDQFFNGQIDAVLTVSRGFGLGKGAGGKGGYRPDDVPDLGEVFSSELNSDSENKNYAAIYEKMRALQVSGSPLPPVVLRLILTSHGKEPVNVEILEVNSDLGNFAVKPDKLNLVPEKATAPDPMTSLMGVTSDEIAVKVGLRVGGKTESRTLLVKSLFTPDGKAK